ncbi:MAG: DoxX family protein [Halobacteria archaeon]|nr:DoxX family protein [Halobacteria archaeon]
MVTRTGWGIVLIRLAVGIVFVVHGAGKLLGVGPAAAEIGGFAGYLSALGIPLPTVFAWLVAANEFFGGLFVLAGFLTRFAGIGIAVEMLVVILLVHLPNGFIISSGSYGYEFALTLMLISLTLAVAGVDCPWRERCSASRW